MHRIRIHNSNNNINCSLSLLSSVLILFRRVSQYLNKLRKVQVSLTWILKLYFLNKF